MRNSQSRSVLQIKLIPITPTSDQVRSQNFSLQHQYNIKKTSGKNEEKYVLGDYL